MSSSIEQLEDLGRLRLLGRRARLAEDLQVDRIKAHEAKGQAAAHSTPDCQLCSGGPAAAQVHKRCGDSQENEEGTDANKPPELWVRRRYVDMFLGGSCCQLGREMVDRIVDRNSGAMEQ